MAAAILVPVVFFFFPAAMALAASMDVVTMTIPNRICLAVTVGYLVVAIALGVPLDAIAINLSCAAAVLATTFAMFSFGWIGGGDAKLAAATALWLGWGMMFEYFARAAIYGGALTLLILAARQFVLPVFLARQAWIARLHDAKNGVPYGAALAAAGLMAYPHSEIWRAATGL
jgi:prepilin peptidase CpaA